MPNLKYEGQFQAMICLNANLPKREVIEKFSGIPILAADGAATQLIEMGIMPDYVIGDLDSFLSSKHKAAIPIDKLIHKPDQDANDFEKNLEFALAHNWNNIIVLGIHGGQMEHTLNNWSVFIKYSRKMNLMLYDLERYAFSLHEAGDYVLDTYEGEMLSLIPQPEARVILKNFQWNLNEEVLKLGEREGARNISTHNKVYIKLIEGELLIFTEARIPKMVKMVGN